MMETSPELSLKSTLHTFVVIKCINTQIMSNNECRCKSYRGTWTVKSIWLWESECSHALVASVLLYRRQLTHQSRAERGFKGRYMTAASFDVDGICTPVCILKGSMANSFNVCLLALTLLNGQIHLCTPYSSSTAQCLFFKAAWKSNPLISGLYLTQKSFDIWGVQMFEKRP